MTPALNPGLGRGRVAATGAIAVDPSYVGLVVDCAGTFAATFSAAATLGNQFQVAFYCTSGAVTLTTNGAETIQSPAGSANTFVLNPGQGAYVSCDGTGLKIVLGAGLAPSPSGTITASAFIGGTFSGTTGTFTGQVIVPDGAAATPGLRVTSEASGLYRVSSTALGLSVAGTLRATVSTTALTIASGINLAMSGASTATFGTGAFSVGGRSTFQTNMTLVGAPTDTEGATSSSQSRIITSTGNVGADIYPGSLGHLVLTPRNSAARVVAIWNGNPLTMVTEWTTTAQTFASGINLAMPAGVATTATSGFFYAPSCAGTPTGTPTAISNGIPMVVDRTNHKLYFFSGGAWRDAGP